MNRTSLNGKWNLTYGPKVTAAENAVPLDNWPTIPATVPGTVELDLMAAGELEDPMVGNRVFDLRKYETYEWWYRRTFETPPYAAGKRVELVFEGLDCYGTIRLNGKCIGITDNMLIPHRFGVTDFLSADRENDLTIQIAPPVLEARRHESSPYEYAQPWNFDSLYIRKAPHMFGWDIMPRVVSAGLWRGVYLETVPPTHWRSVYWTTLKTDPEQKTATLFVDWDFATERSNLAGLRVRLTLARGTGTVHSAEVPILGTHGRRTIELTDVDLWWPRGYGASALYDARLELLDSDGTLLDIHKCRIGLRTVELKRTEFSTLDEPGEFVFVVNGQKIFIRGTNWVPLSAFHSNDAEQLHEVFAMAVDLNCNMLRCWGGNVYEDHPFFDLCDENGILVWQDFALACHIYPQTDEFANRIRHEAESVVKKLRNHPSLALWAGNNETDMAFDWDGALNLNPNTERLSREVLPRVCLEYDPKRPYLPSSPYRSPEVMRRGGDLDVMPEAHLWRGRPYFKDAFYTEQPAHFVSETGYHGCPTRETLEQCLDSDCLWPWQDNEQWLAKAVRPVPEATQTNYRIPLMEKLISLFFDSVPDNLDDFIIASQIVQAEANKFFVEWWRQSKWRRTGILWWNLRDGWPIFSDAVVDYYNRKKLAYWYLQRSQQDICAIVGEPENGQHSVWIVNDTLQEVFGTVTVTDADSGELLFKSDFVSPENDKSAAGYLDRPKEQAMWFIEWSAGQQTGRNHYLAGEPPFKLTDYFQWLETLDVPAIPAKHG